MLSVGSKEMYLQQISEGENMINEGLALVMQGRTGLETVARTEVAELEPQSSRCCQSTVEHHPKLRQARNHVSVKALAAV